MKGNGRTVKSTALVINIHSNPIKYFLLLLYIAVCVRRGGGWGWGCL